MDSPHHASSLPHDDPDASLAIYRDAFDSDSDICKRRRAGRTR
ncbi:MULTISPECIES: hypothetical protein [Streptomyces]|nr:hypothetical protein [Streptomyces sp. 9-7]